MVNHEQDGECQYCEGVGCPKCCAHCLNVANRAALENAEPYLGLATNMQMIDELAMRAEIAQKLGEKWPTSLEIVSPGPFFADKVQDLLDELKYRAHAAENSGYDWPAYRTVDASITINIDGGEL